MGMLCGAKGKGKGREFSTNNNYLLFVPVRRYLPTVSNLQQKLNTGVHAHNTIQKQKQYTVHAEITFALNF